MNTLPLLKCYKRPAPPVRPPSLVMPDHELIDALRVAKAGQGESFLLGLFGQFREEVLDAEAKGAANIVLLLRVARVMHDAGEVGAAFHVLSNCCNWYGFHVSEPPESNAERQALAERHSRYREVMSDELMMFGFDRRVPREETKPEPEPESDAGLIDADVSWLDDDGPSANPAEEATAEWQQQRRELLLKQARGTDGAEQQQPTQQPTQQPASVERGPYCPSKRDQYRMAREIAAIDRIATNGGRS